MLYIIINVVHTGGVAPLSPQFGANSRSLNSNAQGSQFATAENQNSSPTINDAFMREELSLQELTDLACMFSFAESGKL